MKLISFSIANVVAVVLVASGCQSITHFDSSKMKAVEIASTKATPEQLKEAGVVIDAGGESLFLIRKGESLPLVLTVQLPMATVGAGQNILVFTSDTYLLISHAGLRISPDGQRWANIEDLSGQRKLFGFSSGTMSMGLSASESGPAQATIDIGVK